MKFKAKHLISLRIKIDTHHNFILKNTYFDGHDCSIIKIEKNITISQKVMILTHDASKN